MREFINFMMVTDRTFNACFLYHNSVFSSVDCRSSVLDSSSVSRCNACFFVVIAPFRNEVNYVGAD